jgi:hypothetical protein
LGARSRALEQTAARADAELEILDIADFNLPVLDKGCEDVVSEVDR